MLEHSDGLSPAVVLKAAQGATLATFPTSDLPGIADVAWSPDSTAFAFTLKDKQKGGLYVCRVAECRYRCVLPGGVVRPAWSSDSRHLACLRQSDLPEDLPQSVRVRRGSLVVLDPRRGFATAFTIRGAIGPYAFSPDNSRIAFVEMAKDEYGDLGKCLLRVAEAGSGRTVDLASDRRKLEWIWAGNDSLVVATHDRYAVPCLSLLGLSGSKTALVTAPEFAAFRPRAFEAETGRVVYEVLENAARQDEGDLWAVRPGGRPEHLPPNDPAFQRGAGGRASAAPGKAPAPAPPGAPSE